MIQAINSYYARETLAAAITAGLFSSSFLTGVATSLALTVSEVALVTLAGGTKEFAHLGGLLTARFVCVLATVGFAKAISSSRFKDVQVAAFFSSTAVILIRLVVFSNSSTLFPSNLPTRI